MIRLALPPISEADIAAVAAVLRSGWLVQGREVAAFEAEVARLAGTEHAIAVSSGTAALHLAALALGIGPGDRVAVPTYSWPATANVVTLVGATPLFVDIEARTLGMDPERLGALLEREPAIRAVLPVHAFGGCANLPEILAAVERRGIPVLEDAACALGAQLAGRPAGSWGKLGCFSFHPRKVVTTGEGGAVVTQDGALADRVRALRNHGIDPQASGDFILPGLNCRMTEFQAALGRGQLARHAELIRIHRRVAGWYEAALAGMPLRLPEALAEEAHVFQAYVVRLPEAAAARRQEVIAQLRARGVESNIGTHHIPLTRFFRERHGFRPGDFPVTDSVAGAALALPMHHALTRTDVTAVAAALRAALSESAS